MIYRNYKGPNKIFRLTPAEYTPSKMFTTYHYVTEDSFLTYNPWFRLALENRLDDLVRSGKMRDKIEEVVDRKFPALWHRHMSDSSAYRDILSRLHGETQEQVNRVRDAADAKVRELASSESMVPLREKVFNTAMQRYETFQNGLNNKFAENESNRNKQLKEMETKLDNLSTRNTFLTFSSIALGIGLIYSKL